MGASQSPSYDWVTFDDDEAVIWEGQPRVISVVKYAVVYFIVGLGLFIASTAAGVLGVAAAAILTGITYKRMVNTEYVLTDKRLYRKSGFLSESTESAPLRQVQNTSLSKDILGSRRGYGSVSISTAAGAGDIRIGNIDDPSDFKQLLTEYTEAASTQSQTSSSGADQSASMAALTEELETFQTNIERLNEQFSGDEQ